MIKQALEKDAVARKLINKLAARFKHNDFFGEGDSFKYNSELKAIKKDDSSLSHLVWAYFYACSQDREKAIKYFKNAFRLSSSNAICLGMYIDYLILIGKTSDAFDLINKNRVVLQNDPLSAPSLQFLAYPLLARCDIPGMDDLIDNTMRLIETYQISDLTLMQLLDLLKAKNNEALIFKNKTGFDDRQFDALSEIYIDIADKNDFEGIRILYECDENYDVYALMLYTTSQSVEKICNANFELAERIAKNNIFGNSKFAIMFEYLDIDMQLHMVDGI